MTEIEGQVDVDRVTTESLLHEVMKNRVVRKGKTILTNSVLASLVISIYFIELHDGFHWGYLFLIIPLVAVGIAYFVHSICFVVRFSESEPSEEIEKAYAWTTPLPYIDTILELYISYKQGNKTVFAFNTLFFLGLGGYFIVMTGIIFADSSFYGYFFFDVNDCIDNLCLDDFLDDISSFFDEDKAENKLKQLETDGRVLGMACITAVLALYQLFGDMNEYNVHVSSSRKKTQDVPAER
jgi:hypothetical protein